MSAAVDSRPSLPRFVLHIGLTVLVVALAAFLFERSMGLEARFQRFLELESRLLRGADRKAFLALQDRTDGEWFAQQQEAIEWRVYSRRRGEAPGEPAPTTRVRSVEVQGSTAAVLIDTVQNGDTRRQVTFFVESEAGWLHTGPDEQFWGAPRTAQTEQLVWLYRERDEGWVGDLLDDGEAMARQLHRDLEISAGGPITIEVAYRPDAQQRVDAAGRLVVLPTLRPVLALPTPLLAGVDEQEMRDELSLALAEYLSRTTSGWTLRWEADSRSHLLRSIIAWEASRLTGSGLDGRPAELLAGAAAANELLGLDEVWPNPGLPAAGNSDLRYAQGWTAVDYIAARHGPESVARLLHDLRASTSAAGALRHTLGYQDVREFETGWLEYVRDRYGRKE